MNQIMAIWIFLSGKKTTISAVLFGVAQIFTAIGQVEIAGSVTDIASALLGLGLTHKGVKKINQ